MSAPLDNKFALKYKTPEERQVLCRQYIEYIKTGKSKEYFPPCSIQTFERYVKDFPQDFDTEKIEEAERRGLGRLEEIGFDGMMGKIKGFNPTTWIFVTKNRLGWRDKQDLTSANEGMQITIRREP
jgi:hypothetical protein